jgi:hypothetical protein
MSWVAVGLTVGSAVLGQQQAKRQREQQYQQNMAQAAQTQYSPWSGMSGGQVSTQNSSDLAGGLQGGMAGAQMANSFGAFGTKPPAANGVDAPIVAGTKGTASSMNMYDPSKKFGSMIG